MTTTTADDWRRPRPTPEQLRHDLYGGLAVTVLALFSLTLARSTGAFLLGPPPSWPEQVFWTVAVTLPLIWRRRFPVTSTLVVSATFIAAQARSAPETQLSSWALFAVIYSLGAWGPDRRLSRRVRLGVIGTMFAWLGVYYAVVTVRSIPPDAFADAVGPVPPVLAALVTGVLVNVLAFGFAYFFGETAWLAARRQHELTERAEELRRSQAEARGRAVIGERVRIARELHDVVAHHVSVMGVQASAARRVFEKDPAKARTALTAIEETARTAVDELRRMLGVLRAGEGDPGRVEPPAGIDQVAAVVERARDAGLRATLGVYGDRVPLPESVSQAVYRVVQEAVTNVLKHAGGAGVLDVRIRYLAREMEVDVTDDGRSVRPANADGLGLVGMRERVATHGGTLEAGPRAGGGWRVRARLPLAVAVTEAA
ncbi:sensor histidine kinase [Micromonospora sp. URMC 103]|uniref:sensor histidine kinase n=1 Tax=Micromonospora sp. URMC 103 TaxID=3423406 RepID=UPI003F1ABF78